MSDEPGKRAVEAWRDRLTERGMARFDSPAEKVRLRRSLPESCRSTIGPPSSGPR